MVADFTAIAMRLSAALAIGAVVGVERHLRGQPAGLRTHALVALAAGLAVMISAPISGDASVSPDAQSRVLQGILTGIGFLGAGVILHGAQPGAIHGLTSAAGIWVTAVLGALCGQGHIDIALLGLALVMIVLVLGGRIEDALDARLRHDRSRADGGGKSPLA